MKDLIKIENINHRLGNDPHYFLSQGETCMLFTPYDIHAARVRYERAIRRRPTVDQIFRATAPAPEPVKPSIWARLFRRKSGLAEMDREIAAYSVPEIRRQAD